MQNAKIESKAAMRICVCMSVFAFEKAFTSHKSHIAFSVKEQCKIGNVSNSRGLDLARNDYSFGVARVGVDKCRLRL